MMDGEEKSEKEHSFEGAEKALERGSNALNLTVQVSETEGLSAQRTLVGGAYSTQRETSESLHLSIPVQETESSCLPRNTKEAASSFREINPGEFSTIPVSLPPTDECQLCSRKFRGNFRQYNPIYCVDCRRFSDSEFCDTKDYKRPSGPPMTIF